MTCQSLDQFLELILLDGFVMSYKVHGHEQLWHRCTQYRSEQVAEALGKKVRGIVRRPCVFFATGFSGAAVPYRYERMLQPSDRAGHPHGAVVFRAMVPHDVMGQPRGNVHLRIVKCGFMHLGLTATVTGGRLSCEAMSMGGNTIWNKTFSLMGPISVNMIQSEINRDLFVRRVIEGYQQAGFKIRLFDLLDRPFQTTA